MMWIRHCAESFVHAVKNYGISPHRILGRTVFYRPQRSCGQGNIFTPVCHSVHRGGGSASVHAGIPPPPRDQTPPRADTSPRADPPGPDPPGADPPGADTPPSGPDTPLRTRHLPPPPGSRLQHTVYERPVRILLECILVQFCVYSFI